MPSPRDLLAVPDAAINEALARVMGWRKDASGEWVSPSRGGDDGWGSHKYPPEYCSEYSLRSMLGRVEERIFSLAGGLKDYVDAIDELKDFSIMVPAGTITCSLARTRARAALWALDRATAERLIAEHAQGT